jgi:ABC-2 type transport system ATP-binding protein
VAPAITFEDVSKSFRVWHDRNDSLKARLLRRGQARWTDFQALRDVSFEVDAGSTFALIGGNGSGKSTSLKLIARILQPDAGRVRVEGRVSALLELGAGFHPDLTGRENVYLNGAILGLPRKVLDARFDEIVGFAGLEEFIDNQVKTYSSGMFARLGFAVAVHVDPDVLLVDEVLAVGDFAFQRRCAERIAELRSGGRTIVVVSHDMGVIRQLCDKAAWIDHGKLRAVGHTLEVIEEYEKASDPAVVLDATGKPRYGTGRSRVTRAELVDGVTGEPLRRFAARQPVSMEFRIDGVPTDSRLVLGVHLWRTDGVHVNNISTRTAVPLRGPTSGPVDLRYTMPSLPLLAGTYLLTSELFDDEAQQLVDRLEHFHFEVFPEQGVSEDGLVALGGTWERCP